MYTAECDELVVINFIIFSVLNSFRADKCNTDTQLAFGSQVFARLLFILPTLQGVPQTLYENDGTKPSSRLSSHPLKSSYIQYAQTSTPFT